MIRYNPTIATKILKAVAKHQQIFLDERQDIGVDLETIEKYVGIRRITLINMIEAMIDKELLVEDIVTDNKTRYITDFEGWKFLMAKGLATRMDYIGD